VLLWFVVRRVLEEGPQADSLRHGVLAVAGFQLLGLALDLVGIRDRPFSWVRAIAQTAVQRVTLIHVAVIAGYWFGLTRGGLGAFFGPFAVLKALADVGGVLAALGVSADTEESPRWLAAAMNRMAPGKGDFAEHWRARKEQERRLFAEDELERSAAPARAAPRRERRRRR
jgi:hypothetical protein